MTKRSSGSVVLVFVGAVTAAGCVVSGEEESGSDDDESLAIASACVTLDNRSLIETSPTIVTEARFNLKRVFDQIRTTTPAGTSPPSDARSMFSAIYSTFSRCISPVNADPNGYGVQCWPFPASFASEDPFTGIPGKRHFKAVALVNRFDLAPTTFATCGESRIVYWVDDGDGRNASMILELRTPPVVLADGTRSCKPIADFWGSLSTISDLAVRAAKLEQFYFNGLPGMPFPPVSARGVGFEGPGQVRLNTDGEWNLRELKFQRVCTTSNGVTTCRAQFVWVPSKNNPSQLLFAGTHTKSASFQDWFVSTAVPRLAKATSIHQLALGNANDFNTVESVSQPMSGDPTSVNYRVAASSALRTRISNKLVALGSSLTVNNVLDRATTQTCGGCHNVSNGAALGGSMTFPSANGFTHINASGTLSPALTNKFLPNRKTLLSSFLCSANSGKTTSDAMSTTLSGAAADAPN